MILDYMTSIIVCNAKNIGRNVLFSKKLTFHNTKPKLFAIIVALEEKTIYHTNQKMS